MPFIAVCGEVFDNFGAWYSLSFPGTWASSKGPLKMGPIGCPETLVTNYESVLHKIPEERRSHF
jgi:hypothetical protein